MILKPKMASSGPQAMVSADKPTLTNEQLMIALFGLGSSKTIPEAMRKRFHLNIHDYSSTRPRKSPFIHFDLLKKLESLPTVEDVD